MNNDDFVTRQELDSEYRLTKRQKNDLWFWWFYSMTVVVLAATLMGIFILLFELENQLSDIKSELVEIKLSLGDLDTRVGNVETYLKLNGDVTQQQ